MYSCDFSDKKIYSTKSSTDSYAVSTVKQVVNNKRGRKSKKETNQRNGTFDHQNHCKNGENEKQSKKSKSNAQIKPNKCVIKKDNSEVGNEEKITVQVQAHNLTTMNSRSGQTWKPCGCKSSCSTLIGGNGAGWEGTAILHHGSIIKIGCHQFVFSITNYGTQMATNPSSYVSTIKTVTVKSPANVSTSTK